MFPRQVIGGCRRRCLAMLFIALACGSGKDDPRAREQAPRVELDLSAIAPRVELELIKATAERSSGGEVRLDCTATLKNDSGVALRVRTSFFSVFDGIEVLILRESGEKLGRQSYLFHQSPYSVGRELLLKTGETRETLAFPVNLPKDVRSVRVLLVGVLPGCERAGLLCSGAKTVAIPPQRDSVPVPGPADVRSMRPGSHDPLACKRVGLDVAPRGSGKPCSTRL